MDKTRLYHLLSTTFGALILAQGVIRLSGSFSLLAGLFALVGAGMMLVSGLALVRPDLDETEEPATWLLATLAIGILLIFAGTVIEFL